VGVAGDRGRDEAAGQEKVAGGGDVVAGLVPVIGKPKERSVGEEDRGEDESEDERERESSQNLSSAAKAAAPLYNSIGRLKPCPFEIGSGAQRNGAAEAAPQQGIAKHP